MLWASSLAAVAEKHLIIVPMSGTDEQFVLSQIGKIVFEGEVMYFYSKSGEQLGYTPLSEVGKVQFTGTDEETSLDESNAGISIYYDAAQDNMIIKGLKGNNTVRVYSMQGQIVKAVTANGSGTDIITLHLGDVQDGTYILQAGAEIMKFMKR